LYYFLFAPAESHYRIDDGLVLKPQDLPYNHLSLIITSKINLTEALYSGGLKIC